MNKIYNISISAILVLLVLSLVSAITLTADATRSVTVPLAARGTVCLVSEDGACTDKTGEALFGNAIVENMGGDQFGMILVQFGDNVYRSTTLYTIYLFSVTLTDGSVVTATSRNMSALSDLGIENYEAISLLGLAGKLSLVLPNGEEVVTTGDTVTYSDEKGSTSEEEPIGEYYIEYSGLVLEDSDTCTPYSYLDESGEPVKGLSTRECVGVRGVMREGEYKDLRLTFYGTGDAVDHYKLTSITATTSFAWEPASPSEETEDEEPADEEVSSDDATPPEENATEVP